MNSVPLPSYLRESQLSQQETCGTSASKLSRLTSDFKEAFEPSNSGRCPNPGKFYKGRSQEKTLLLRLEFFLLLSPYDRARSVLTYRAMCSVAGHCAPAVWVFSTSGFHRFLATKPVCSETSKAERSQIWRP